jgi:hypothetical protein
VLFKDFYVHKKTVHIVDVVSLDIYDEDREKRDYVRLILNKAQQCLDWFRLPRGVIVIRPVSLYYAVRELVAPDELRAATYIDWRIGL